MKTADLKAKMKRYDVSTPMVGTGRNGRVVNHDLETALGDYFIPERSYDSNQKIHLAMRRAMTPQKSYRYDKMSPAEQDFLWDSEDWYGEKKFNGWRMIVTYVPEHGFMFWGGNISYVDFLPTDYTEHVRLTQIGRIEGLNKPFAIDSEALCFVDVVNDEGQLSCNTLEAVRTILGGDPERALTIQDEGAPLVFKCFDLVEFVQIKNPKTLEYDQLLHQFAVGAMARRKRLANYFNIIGVVTNFSIANLYEGEDKKTALKKIWNAGDEGMILKHKSAPYTPDSRLKSQSVKVKRTMSQDISVDDIDAFISGYVLTSEWSKRNLIGGVKLSVWLDDGNGELTLHEIATVSSMPDPMREQLTVVQEKDDGIHLLLNEDYLYKVLVIDGQELSSRNKRLLHAKADWKRGFREDKLSGSCILQLSDLDATEY